MEKNIKGVSLDSPVTVIKGIGKKRAEALDILGIATLRDLLGYFPRTYVDFSAPVQIENLVDDEKSVVRARLVAPVQLQKTKTGLHLFRLLVSDGTGEMNVILFNQDYTANKMREGDEYIFYGKASRGGLFFDMASPQIEKTTNAVIMPVYSLTAGVNQRMLRNTILDALDSVCGSIFETLPDEALSENDLMPIADAYRQIHRPDNMDNIEKARRRFVFDEFLQFTLGVRTLKSSGSKKHGVPMTQPCDLKPFTSILDYELTYAQKRTVNECVRDLRKTVPMSRIIQGDVGSGKTVVAAALMYYVAKNGYQSCIMAPTEILAFQHFEYFDGLFSKLGVKTALLTGSTKPDVRKKLLEDLKSGEIQVLVGTNALIQKDVAFKNLALTVTDEQHRFGVEQRSRLAEKGRYTHVLVMSATPIPRTLALILYGNFDISVIDELPPGRQTVSTFCVDGSYHDKMYKYLREQVSLGNQAYIVCPLVEDSEDESVKSATDYAYELSNLYLRGVEMRYLHGKMSGKEKDAIMRDFADNKIKVLVSTTVIEVGLNVPNATVMIVENAERFGLSQLHQLRGRVGRGTKKSYCFLVSDTQSEQTRKRLESFCSTNDGFEISRLDLELRGPGDFFGVSQHGSAMFRCADLVRDMEVLNSAQHAADKILENPLWFTDKRLEELKNGVVALFRNTDINILS